MSIRSESMDARNFWRSIMIVTIKLYTLPKLAETFKAKGYEDHYYYLQNSKCEMRDALEKARGYYDSFKCDAQRDAYLFTITGDRVHRDSIIEESMRMSDKPTDD